MSKLSWPRFNEAKKKSTNKKRIKNVMNDDQKNIGDMIFGGMRSKW